MKTDLNDLFALSQIDDAYLGLLTDELLDKGKRIASSIIQSKKLYCFVIEDIEDYILDIIVYILANYRNKSKTFEEFAMYVMYKRLVSKMTDSYLSKSRVVASLDDTTEDGIPFIELIADSNIKNIPDDISINEMNLMISSPKSNDNNTNRTKKRVYRLLNAGYSSSEIKRILKLNENQFRYILKLINEDINFVIKVK